MEGKLESLRGLRNLKASNIRKLGGKGKTSRQSSTLIPESSDGTIGEYIKDQDHLVCEIECQEIWLELLIEVTSDIRNLDARVMIKLSKEIQGE